MENWERDQSEYAVTLDLLMRVRTKILKSGDLFFSGSQGRRNERERERRRR